MPPAVASKDEHPCPRGGPPTPGGGARGGEPRKTGHDAEGWWGRGLRRTGHNADRRRGGGPQSMAYREDFRRGSDRLYAVSGGQRRRAPLLGAVPPLMLASAISWSSQASVTTTSLLSSTRYSPRASCRPWLIAAGNPRLVALVTTVTGTAAMSRTPAR